MESTYDDLDDEVEFNVDIKIKTKSSSSIEREINQLASVGQTLQRLLQQSPIAGDDDHKMK